MSAEKIKKELVWIRQFIHKKDDENVVIRDVNGKDIASWIDRVDAAIATPPAAQRKPLTDEQIYAMCSDFHSWSEWDGGNFQKFWLDLCRAIEAAHGITGEKT